MKTFQITRNYFIENIIQLPRPIFAKGTSIILNPLLDNLYLQNKSFRSALCPLPYLLGQ